MRRSLAVALVAVAACGLELVGTGSGVDPPSSSGVDGGVAAAPAGDEASTTPAVDAALAEDAAECAADTTTDLANCGGCGKACPAGSEACVDGRCYASLRVSLNVDGESHLVLEGGTIRWYHREYVPPGETTLNGVKWTPTWPSNEDLDDCDCFSTNSTNLVPPLPARAQTVTLTKHAGRSNVTLSQPTNDNDHTLRVRFDDQLGGADLYDVTVRYEAR